MAYFAFTSLLYLCTIIVTLLCGCFTVFLLYLHYVHTSYAHLPSPPRASFILGHLKNIKDWKGRRKKDGLVPLTISFYLKETGLKYGAIYVLFFFHRPLVILGDPEYIKDVYVTHQAVSKRKYLFLAFPFGNRFFGPNSLVVAFERSKWQKKRQIMNPAFHRKSLKGFMSDFNDVCDRFLAKIESLVGKNVHMSNEFSRVALDIIGQVSFNIKIGAIDDPNSPFLNAIASALRYTQAFAEHPLQLFFPSLLSIYNYWPFQTQLMKKQRGAIQFLRNYCRECILKRMEDIKSGKETPDDLLNTLIQHYSMEDIIDEFLTIFISGHETTANWLAFTLYEICRNPDIEKKILHEVKEVLGDKENVDYEDLAKLKYVGQVMQESLRKFPIIPNGNRKILVEDMVVHGHKLYKNTQVLTSLLALNYNPKFWKDPEVYDPDRFSAPENIPNYSSLHLPFSTGPRNCIGQNFAKFEFKVLLARMLRKFKFQLLPGQTDTLECRITLSPRDGVMCKVEPR